MRRKLARGAAFHGLVILLGFFMIYPVLWMIGSSFKDINEIFNSASLIPKHFSFNNYIRGWKFVGVEGSPRPG